jgi:hypothetical protein
MSGVTRAERYVRGSSMAEIAREDGITPPAVKSSLRTVFGHAARKAEARRLPAPVGFRWVENIGRRAGSHLVRIDHGHDPATDRASLAWALSVLAEDEQPTCPCCGRPL